MPRRVALGCKNKDRCLQHAFGVRGKEGPHACAQDHLWLQMSPRGHLTQGPYHCLRHAVGARENVCAIACCVITPDPTQVKLRQLDRRLTLREPAVCLCQFIARPPLMCECLWL